MSPNVHNANELKLFMDWFRETYGREWTVADHLAAANNGITLFTASFGIFVSIIIIALSTYSLIKTCIKYAKDQRTPNPAYTREDLAAILLIHILPIFGMGLLMLVKIGQL